MYALSIYVCSRHNHHLEKNLIPVEPPMPKVLEVLPRRSTWVSIDISMKTRYFKNNIV